ncbi:DUF2283 domain-containing protein [Candidatus Parcubacteria bacterium]|nr:DUF2283 domain-containing protein [Candidatus Parcubacteria bacterium]
MKNERKKLNISYEPEADVLRVEASRKPIDYAVEVGSVVVHFSSRGVPVYLEILEARKFIKRATTLVPRERSMATTVR